MRTETQIRKHLKAINDLLPSIHGKQCYHDTYSECITIKLDKDTKDYIVGIAYKENKAISHVCRELIEKGIKERIEVVEDEKERKEEITS